MLQATEHDNADMNAKPPSDHSALNSVTSEGEGEPQLPEGTNMPFTNAEMALIRHIVRHEQGIWTNARKHRIAWQKFTPIYTTLSKKEAALLGPNQERYFSRSEIQLETKRHNNPPLFRVGETSAPGINCDDLDSYITPGDWPRHRRPTISGRPSACWPISQWSRLA